MGSVVIIITIFWLQIKLTVLQITLNANRQGAFIEKSITPYTSKRELDRARNNINGQGREWIPER